MDDDETQPPSSPENDNEQSKKKERKQGASSYIGVITRNVVPIDIKSWDKVPMQVKERLWNTIKQMYELKVDKRKSISSKANASWRSWKNAIKLSKAWGKNSELQRERRCKQKYQQRIGRKGYSEIREKLASDGETSPTRARQWVKGREIEPGLIPDDDSKKMVDLILDVEKKNQFRNNAFT
ncbi:hypothetical protein ACFE04_011406 [Oxalis oulophora]